MAERDNLIVDISLKCLDGTIIPFATDGDIASFKYIEDMNMGFPIVEMVVSEAAFRNLNRHIQGSEIIKINKLKYREFELNNMDFRVKAFGIATPTKNKFGNINFIKFVAHHMDQERLMNFDKTVYSGKIKLIHEMVQLAYDGAGVTMGKVIEATEPLPQYTWWNLFIPYTADAMKVIRKLSHYAMSTAGRGGYAYYHNKEAMHFKSIVKVMADYFPQKEIEIFEGMNDYIIKDITISPFNDFQTMSLGNVKSIVGYDYLEKRCLREDWDSDELTYPMTDPILPIYNPNAKKCLRPYFTNLDDPKWMKAFAETIYVGQMFNINMDLQIETVTTRDNKSNDFKIGDVIPVKFLDNTPDHRPYHNMSGKWLIKSNLFKYTDFNVEQHLKLVKAGIDVPRGGPYTPA